MADVEDLREYLALSLCFGGIFGWMMGSALRVGDSHFSKTPEGESPKPAPKKKGLHGLDSTRGQIVIKLELPPVSANQPSTGFYLGEDLFGRFKNILPKNCDSFSSLSAAIAKDGGVFVWYKGLLGLLMPVIAVPMLQYPDGLEPWICWLGVAATTYLATGYFRGNTDKGFWMNPIGVTTDAICKKLPFGSKDENQVPNSNLPQGKENRAEMVLKSLEKRGIETGAGK